jgi:hypothetical protein
MTALVVKTPLGRMAKDFVSYEHSSASFYELGIPQHFLPTHYRDL